MSNIYIHNKSVIMYIVNIFCNICRSTYVSIIMAYGNHETLGKAKLRLVYYPVFYYLCV